MSPTQRSKQLAEQMGYRVAIVEKWNHFAKIRQDLFGCIDLLCMMEDQPLLAIQCTTSGNVKARITKCRAIAAIWTSTGNYLEVWGWAKRGPRGKRKTWERDRHAL